MRSRDLEIENRHLREAVADSANHRHHHCNGQEVTIKLLGKKSSEKDIEEDDDEISEPPFEEEKRTWLEEKDLTNRLQQKERELLESELEVDERLEQALKQVAQLQSALDISQSELFDLKAKFEEESQTKCDEIEILVNDLERANQRAALAEIEVRHLKEQLAAAKQSLQLADQIQKAPDMEQAVDVVARSALEIELAAKQKEISQLVDDIQRLQSTLNNLQETSASKIAQLEDLVNEKDKMIVELGEKLVKQQDYDEIKKELSLLKSVEMMCSKSWASNNNNEESRKDEEIRRHVLEQSDSNCPMKIPKSEDSHTATSLQNLDTDLSHVVTKEEQRSRSPTPSKSATDMMMMTDRKPTPTAFESSPQAMNAMTMTSSPEPSPTSKDSMMLTTADKTSLEKLQEVLRINIEKYANDTLNTLNISRCVRELLSVHNIGQRLFAKFVLGLSQGTVSELLSKPKPWDKLTEKGRDSYRKMHAWASDEQCILMLKSLVPRRGKESGCSSMSNFKSDDQGTEERIAQILNEAQMAMMNAKQQQQGDKKSGIVGASTPTLSNGNALISNMTSDSRSGDDNRADNNNNNSNDYKISHVRDLSNTNGSRRSRKYENDDIPQEMVARIYQEELAKLVGQRVEESFRTPRDQYERTQEEIRQALTIYHQELTRLSHLIPQTHPNSFNHFLANGNAFANNLAAQHHTSAIVPVTTSSSNGSNHHHPHHLPPQECPVDATVGSRTRSDSSSKASSARDEPEIRHHGSAFSLVRPKTEPNSTSSSTSNNKSSSSSGNSQYHLHNSSPAPPPLLPIAEANTPGSGPPGGGGNNNSSSGNTNNNNNATEDLSTSASPLQRMQSITNSLLSQSSVPSMPNPPQRPAKAVLPPITQHQFDQYNNLNTEDIVKKVKEQLSQYSISQRLFGESVLGLSQGSVSDLLARPKPWHMLTQKGREPFIRMKIFLEDDNAVHKLVASQYKIAPEKLMRTGGGFGNTTNPSGVLSSFGTGKLASRTPETNHRIPPEPRLPPNSNSNSGSLFSSQGGHHNPPRTSCITPDTMPMSLTVNSSNSNSAATSLVYSATNNRKPSSRGYSQPSVYEMAALTTDLDTQTITSKIKETLMAHNIGQKIFGEVVLGLSQGSVSELLSKPKPWHMLSIKGREPFIRMQMWLNDPHNVEMLQTIKNERREANKRRRTGDGPMDSPRSNSDNQIYGYSFPPPSPYPPAKKPRVLFTDEQKEALRLAFNLDPYPSTATIEFLANELNLSVRTITNWFHNHRMRMKQHGANNSDDDTRKSSSDIPSPNAVVPVREGMGFDPIHYRVLLSQRLSEKFREKQAGGQPFTGSYSSGIPFLYSPYRNCSPLSSSGDDAGTLDLSMSSQLRNSVNSGGAGKLDNAGGSSSTDDRSNSEMNDDSNLSQDPTVADVSDRDSPDDNRSNHQHHRSRRCSPFRQHHHQQQPVRLSTSASNTTTTTTTGGSSNRRKPAMPQWVDPGLELSPDSDVHTDDEDDDVDDDDEDAIGEQEQIINGVCVRQTEDFDLLLPREETVHIVPVPAPDSDRRHKKNLGSSSLLTTTPNNNNKLNSRFAAVDRSSFSDRRVVDFSNQSRTTATATGTTRTTSPRAESAEDLTNGNECAVKDNDDDIIDDIDDEDDVDDDDSDKKVFSDDGGDESWDDAAEAKDRRKNIEKLQQRLEKEDAGDDWEF